MGNDVIYPGGVTVTDAEHTALQSLGLHPENGVEKTNVEGIVTETRDAQAAVAEAAQAEDAPTQSELDARTEQQPEWDGRSERRSGTDRRVLDGSDFNKDADRRVATSDRRAEPPAKTEIDTTVTEQPPAENAAVFGDTAPEVQTAEQASAAEVAQAGQAENADGNIESALSVTETGTPAAPNAELEQAPEPSAEALAQRQAESEAATAGNEQSAAAQTLKPAEPQA